MKKLSIVPLILIALPLAGIAAAEQKTGSATDTNIDQSHPGSTLSTKEQIAAKHLAAAAAHEQAEMHHKAAAEAAQQGQQKEHAVAAEKSSTAACEKSTEALMSSLGK